MLQHMNGMGDNTLRYFVTPGREHFDWYVKLKRDLTSEASYSLNHFARTICGDAKDDIHYKEIPILHKGSDEDRAKLARYCVQDSVLLARLNKARNMIVEILQFSSVFGVFCSYRSSFFSLLLPFLSFPGILLFLYYLFF